VSPSSVGGPGETKTGAREAMNARRLTAAARASASKTPAQGRHCGSRRKLHARQRAATGRATKATASEQHADAPDRQKPPADARPWSGGGGCQPGGQGERPQAQPEEPGREQPAVRAMHIVAHGFVERRKVGLEPVQEENGNDQAADSAQTRLRQPAERPSCACPRNRAGLPALCGVRDQFAHGGDSWSESSKQ